MVGLPIEEALLDDAPDDVASFVVKPMCTKISLPKRITSAASKMGSASEVRYTCSRTCMCMTRAGSVGALAYTIAY